MKQIRKGDEPIVFRTWREEIRPRNSIPPWDDFPDPPRGTVKARVASDQAQICCYCTGAIASGNYHIEHFRPRDPFANLTYRWPNLLASCMTTRRSLGAGKIVETQQHCGDAKGNWFVEGTTVDPQTAGVEALFRFPMDGTVHPAKNLAERYAAVKQSIDELNLNAPALIERRLVVLGLASDDVELLTRSEWTVQYLQPAPDGSLHEFWPALRYNYDKHWHALFAR